MAASAQVLITLGSASSPEKPEQPFIRKEEIINTFDFKF
jgi:hypothetical protein